MPLSEENLEERKKGIGGSDVAPVMGLSKWKTPLEVYYDKIGIGIPVEVNEAMDWGIRLEPVIRQKYADETGFSVTVPGQIIRHPQHDFMIANLDGIANGNRVLEVKTARDAREWGEEGTDEIPQYYLLQVQHYMIVTGYEIADLAALIGGQDFRIYEIPADKELQGLIIEAEAQFWDMVQNKIEPDPVSYADLITKYKRSIGGKVVQADETDISHVERLKEVRAQMKELEELEEAYKTSIMKRLEDGEILEGPDGAPLITWKSTKPGNYFDSKAFQKANPDLYSAFLTPKAPQRRFLIK